MLLQQLLKRDRHLLLNDTRVVDVSTDAEHLGSRVPLSTESSEPRSSSSGDGRGDRDSLHVGDGGRASEKTNIGREGGLQSGLSLFALDGLDQSRLLSTDVSTSASVEVDIERVSGSAGVLADKAGLVRLIDGLLDVRAFLVELSSDVDVSWVLVNGRDRNTDKLTSSGVHSSTSDETALDELVGVTSHDLSVFTRSRLSLIGVDDKVSWSKVSSRSRRRLRHTSASRLT